MNVDVTQYKPIIKNVLDELKVPANQREDLTQECYIALLEKLKPGATRAYVWLTCRSRVIDIWRSEKHLDSLSDPRTAHKVSKIAQPAGPDVSDEKLDEAISSLPHDQYKVVWGLFIDGLTLAETATQLQLSVRKVRTTRDKGIKNLKKFFEV